MIKTWQRFRNHFIPAFPHPVFSKKATPRMRMENNAWLREHGDVYATRWAHLSLAIWVAAFIVRDATPLYLAVGIVGLASGGALMTLMWLNHQADRGD